MILKMAHKAQRGHLSGSASGPSHHGSRRVLSRRRDRCPWGPYCGLPLCHLRLRCGLAQRGPQDRFASLEPRGRLVCLMNVIKIHRFGSASTAGAVFWRRRSRSGAADVWTVPIAVRPPSRAASSRKRRDSSSACYTFRATLSGRGGIESCRVVPNRSRIVPGFAPRLARSSVGRKWRASSGPDTRLSPFVPPCPH